MRFSRLFAVSLRVRGRRRGSNSKHTPTCVLRVIDSIGRCASIALNVRTNASGQLLVSMEMGEGTGSGGGGGSVE